MNHVYRVIWSKVKHCYVVVSEIAKRNGKSSSKVSRAGITALALVGTISLGTSVYADNTTGNSTLTADQQAVYNEVLHELENNGVHYVSVKGTSKDADTNFNNDGAKGNGAIAIGEKAKSTNSSDIAIGSGANSAGGWGMAIGVDAQNTAQLGMAVGYATKVEAAQGLALGVQAKVTKVRGIGIGTNANVSGEDGISFGSQTKAAGQDAISIGTSASSSAMRGIAVGKESNVAATAARGIAIGDGAYVGPVTDKHKGTAMPKPGDEWKPDMPFQPKNDDTKPEEYNKTPQENSLAIGMRASAFGYQNVAIGAAAEAHDTNSTAVGVAAVAKGHHSTALGKQARTYGQETTSVGHWADTRDEFATALGAKSIAYKKGSTALGSNARAYDENSVAIGANSIAKEAVDGKAVYTDEEVKAASGIVSVGHPDYKVGDKEVKANYRRIVNVAGGISDHDAVNVAQLKAVADMVTKGAVHYISVKGESQDNDSNYKNDGAKGKGAVAIGEKALASKGGTVSIGRNAHIEGNGGNTDGEGSVAIGDNALITTNGLDLASIALGKNAKVLNGSGKQERGLSFTPDNFDKPGFFGRGNTLPKNADKVPGGIAIGTNSFARSGSIQLGHHTFAGHQMGGIDITESMTDSTKDTNEQANIVGMTTIGTNTYNKGALANMYGAYSIITGDFTGDGGTNSWTYGPQNFGANVVGSLNSIRSKGHSGSSGVANSIVGVANTVENANGTLVYGAGNKITNSIKAISADAGFTTLKNWDDTVTGLQKVIKNSNSGGAVLAIGGGNVADYVRHSQLVGVNNTVTGTENKVSEFNMVDGYKNTVTNGTHVTMIGSENTATDSESTLVMGDKQKVTKVKHGVLLGSQDAEKETTVADIVAIGHNAHVEKEGGIALGSYSIASIDKGIIGYDPLTGKASTETSAIWKATKAALSVGSTVDKNNLITRQITGVAAGTEDTDAVNVAQLKALEKKLSKGGSNVEVVGDQNTGIVVEKDPKENTSTPSTGGTTPSTGGTTPSTGGTTPSTGGTTPSTGGTTPSTGGTTPSTGGTTPSTGGTTPSTGGTTTTPAAESKTVYKVKLDKKVDVGNISINGTENKETITIGKGDNNVIVNNTGLTIAKGPSVTNTGINAGNKKITNVADATEDSDAVNYKQLKQATQGMNEMFGEINRVGAHSAALAALQTLDFDPYNRSQIMAGVSTYKGQQAIALGVAHYSNENTLVHAGLSYAGESDLMANVGISYKFGSEEDKKYLHERNKKLSQYKDGPISSVYILQDEVKQLLEENNGMRKEIEELKAVIKEIQNKA